MKIFLMSFNGWVRIGGEKPFTFEVPTRLGLVFFFLYKNKNTFHVTEDYSTDYL